jgi:RimJ/RimL family protein N-acetyltransferase
MIITERLILREWHDADQAALGEIHSDPEVMRFLGGTKSADETAQIVDRLRRMSAAGEPTFWAAERVSDGAILGWIGLNRLGPEYPFGPALEVGWRLGRHYWGQGYATEGARAAVAHAFGPLRASRVFAFTVPQNERSTAVMCRVGMTRVEGGDFAHPRLAASDPLSRHVLYVAEAGSWSVGNVRS